MGTVKYETILIAECIYRGKSPQKSQMMRFVKDQLNSQWLEGPATYHLLFLIFTFGKKLGWVGLRQSRICVVNDT